MIYFIHNARSGAIKIGQTGNVASRLGGLQTASPDELVLIATVKGGKPQEDAWHARFSYLRRRGEWYEDDAHLWEAIYLAARPNLWAECRRRGGCRAGLAGLTVRHEPSGQLFVSAGAGWSRGDTLCVYQRPPRDVFAGRIIVKASEVVPPMLSSFRAEECAVLSPWRIVCCAPKLLVA